MTSVVGAGVLAVTAARERISRLNLASGGKRKRLPVAKGPPTAAEVLQIQERAAKESREARIAVYDEINGDGSYWRDDYAARKARYEEKHGEGTWNNGGAAHKASYEKKHGEGSYATYLSDARKRLIREYDEFYGEGSWAKKNKEDCDRRSAAYDEKHGEGAWKRRENAFHAKSRKKDAEGKDTSAFSKEETAKFFEGIVKYGKGKWAKIRDEFLPRRSAVLIETRARTLLKGGKPRNKPRG